jgi:hypothetical protein
MIKNMLTILQHNCRKDCGVLTALMETAVKRGADIVLIQEPPIFQKYRHPAYQHIWSPGRIMTARRITSEWTVYIEDRFTKECKGDMQVLALGRRNKQG